MICDTSCHQAIRGIYDTLTFVGEDLEAHPYLLESFEPNDDLRRVDLHRPRGHHLPRRHARSTPTP